MQSFRALIKDLRSQVTWNTNRSKDLFEDYLKIAERAKSDVDKKKRIAERECPTCFYFHRGRVGGAAMTSSNCQICNRLTHFGSTNTDHICEHCSDKYELCVRCVGDLKLRVRRKVERTEGILCPKGCGHEAHVGHVCEIIIDEPSRENSWYATECRCYDKQE